MRHFVYRYGGRIRTRGPSGQLYWFEFNVVSPVANDDDAEYFLHWGTPESGIYWLRETDVAGQPVGAFPPIDMANRVASIDVRKYPSDESPQAPEWRLITETMGDPTLYYHYVRTRLRGGDRGRQLLQG